MVNDIYSPSSMYVDGNPMCPNNGDSGYNQGPPCSDDPFSRANVGVVIGQSFADFFVDGGNIQKDDWKNGVFYGTDANSVDQRCRWVKAYQGYDCPGGWQTFDGHWFPDKSKEGAGNYEPGNPLEGGGGGGAGCHFNAMGNAIDQFDAYKGPANIVQNPWCECNYTLGNNWWQDWVRQWIAHAHAKKGFEWMGWFGKGKAPTWGIDLAACWVNNPRDMIMIQNAMWELKDAWNNLRMPQSLIFDDSRPSSQIHYWGWNEVPVSLKQVSNPKVWDAVFIKLPPAVCGNNGADDRLECLPSAAHERLDNLIDWYVANNYLKLGEKEITNRPGSYIVLLKEWYKGGRAWQRKFFCQEWTFPSKRYQIQFQPIKGSKTGVCYVDKPHAPPAPAPTPAPGPPEGTPIRLTAAKNKCMDLTGGDLSAGNKVQIWDCNGVASSQNWVFADKRLRAGSNPNKCVSFGDMQEGATLTIQDCEFGTPQQGLIYDAQSSTFHLQSQPHMCIDLPGGQQYNGNILWLWTCGSLANQQWTTPFQPHQVNQTDHSFIV